MKAATLDQPYSEEISELKRQWKQCKDAARPQHLCIASRHPAIHRSLQLILDAEPALVLRCSAGGLPHPARQAAERLAIEYAVENLGITAITICEDLPDPVNRLSHRVPTVAARRHPAGRHDGYQGMLRRISGQQALIAQAKQDVLHQLCQLRALPSLADRIADGRLHLFGLFYLSDTGTLQLFDDHSGEFIALGQPIRAAM